jgi:hypothetical protein
VLHHHGFSGFPAATALKHPPASFLANLKGMRRGVKAVGTSEIF